MFLYNSLTRKKEEFIPIKPPYVGLYTCGPTVYNYSHIGNYRAYIFTDTLKRALLSASFEVKHIMNLTDVDDKTIRDSQVAGKTLKEFTEFYTNEFFADIESLNILKADKYIKATDYIGEMVKIIEKLIDNGHAYKEPDGSIYFKVSSNQKYGQLVEIDKDKLRENAKGRIKKDEYEKDSAQDFALWKAWDDSDGDVFWQTSLGKGRPGWHIECSAMSMANLGEHFDIHTGGMDNKFPHHENEIAQSECATGHQFVNYWLHNEMLLVDGKKMSKSVGNYYTLKDIKEKNSPIAFRYLLLQTHYRSPFNFTWGSLAGAEIALKRLYGFCSTWPDGGSLVEKYKEQTSEAISNDLNTPQILALVWEIIKNADILDADKKTTILELDKVLGLGLEKIKVVPMSEEVSALIKERETARAQKDFARSDELRKKINDLGFEVKDTPDGQKVNKI